MLDRSGQWLRDLPARTMFKLLNQPHLRMILERRYGEALDRHHAALPNLGDQDERILGALRRDGIFITTLDALDLPGSAAMLRTATTLAEDFAPEARALAARGEVFMMVPPHQIVQNPHVYLWGLQDRLLDIAEAYLGLPPGYDGVSINYTIADGREISTRKWHRDWEDRRMLKIAIYLHDVEDGGGPLQMICRQDSVQNGSVAFSYGLADDAEIARRFGPGYVKDIVSCEGPRGTVIFNDTARFFHRGKPAVTRDRAAIFYSYFSSRPRHPFFCERMGIRRRDVARLAHELPLRQRAAALWRQQLSPGVRLIPPASV